MRGLENTHLNFCPICGSQNISAVYIIPINYTKDKADEAYSRCLDCRYETDLGGFVTENLQKIRDTKLKDILNGFQ